MEMHLRVSGNPEELTRFQAKHLQTQRGGNTRLNFETVLPTPRDLLEAPSFLEWAAVMVGHHLQFNSRAVASLLRMEWAVRLQPLGAERAVEHLLQKCPEVMQVMPLVMPVVTRHGVLTRTEWRALNWGTRGGCRGGPMVLGEASMALHLKHLGGHPGGILKKLSELWPTLTFRSVLLEEEAPCMVIGEGHAGRFMVKTCRFERRPEVLLEALQSMAS